VTWAYLAEPLAMADKISAAPSAVVSRVKGEPRSVAVVAPPAIVSPAPSDSASSKAQWEMVVRKMVRPQVKRAPAAIAPPAARQSVTEAPIRPLTLFAETEPEKARRLRLVKWGLVAAGVMGVAIWVRPKTEESDPRASISFAGGWSRRDISPPGRKIIAYDLSRDESNYRMEFSWAPSAQPIGWVFRTRDSGNYYGAKLSLVTPGDSSAVAVEHFSVLGGIEMPHSRKVNALMRSEPTIRIRMDASGPVFTLYVQGSPVDNWTDQRLPTGGFGFYEERGQQAVVQALRFTFFNQGALTMSQGSPR